MPDIDGQPDKYEILTYETQPGDIIIHVRHDGRVQLAGVCTAFLFPSRTTSMYRDVGGFAYHCCMVLYAGGVGTQHANTAHGSRGHIDATAMNRAAGICVQFVHPKLFHFAHDWHLSTYCKSLCTPD